MVLLQQIVALLDYLEGNRELALGHLNKSKEGRSLSKRCWTDCASILNAVSANCPTKTPEEWRTYYNEFKFKTLKKIKAQKREQCATGGGLPKKYPLTNTQERLMDILGRDVGDPLPDVRHNPLQGEALQECYVVPNPLIEHDIVPSEVPTDSQNREYDTVPTELPADSQNSPVTNETVVPPQRRHRRRPTRRQQTQDVDNEQLKAAQERLEQIELRSSNATMEQARAINRLAAAIERVADRLNEPLTIVVRNEDAA